MIRYRNASEDATLRIGFHEYVCPTPVNRIFAVRTDTLEMARVDAFAVRGKKSFVAASGVHADQDESDKEKLHLHVFYINCRGGIFLAFNYGFNSLKRAGDKSKLGAKERTRFIVPPCVLPTQAPRQR